jgi:NADH dehydrogenase FAD-containing subunit
MTVCTVRTPAADLIKSPGLPLEKGRLQNDMEMKVNGPPNPWALGDSSFILNAYSRRPFPATAHFAIGRARQLAKNLVRVSKGRATRPFNFHPRARLASIGHRNSVAETHGPKLSGFLAQFLRRGVYLMSCPRSVAISQ